MRCAVGVDIGGTKIAFALVGEDGEILAEQRLPTRAEVETLVDDLAAGIGALCANTAHRILGIGVGVPGYVDARRGVVLEAVNLGWRDVPLADLLGRRLSGSLPIQVQKDANAAVMGEYVFGAARGSHSAALIAIGTGLGLGLMVNGALVTGVGGAAGEIGHIGLDPGGRVCACGLRGCPESVISGVGLLAGAQHHRERFIESPLNRDDLTTQHILSAWQAGDALACLVLDEAFAQMALLSLWCIGLLNPDRLIIGGGLGLALADRLLPYLEQQIAQRTHAAARSGLTIVRSQVASSAVGAAALILGQPG